uniref:Uncharacterized protein n=1 Tax=Onchocerca volvulus TaxID=6282 RepID=A0A8R1Y3R2_ONCVO
MKTNNRAGRFKRNAEQEQGCGKEYSTEMLNELKCIPHAHHSSNATMPTVGDEVSSRNPGDLMIRCCMSWFEEAEFFNIL